MGFVFVADGLRVFGYRLKVSREDWRGREFSFGLKLSEEVAGRRERRPPLLRRFAGGSARPGWSPKQVLGVFGASLCLRHRIMLV